MATDESRNAVMSERMQLNLARVEELSRRMIAAMAARRPHDPGLDGPGPELLAASGMAVWADFFKNPQRLLEEQASWWGKSLQSYLNAQAAFAGSQPAEPVIVPPPDRRFSHPAWESHPWFSYLRQQYLINAETLQRSMDQIEGLPPREEHRLRYFTRAIIDMMAPVNFFATNPEALERARETEGESLVRGLENLVRDIENNNGDLLVTLSDPDAFEVGRNLGTTPGQVVFRNRILELIQISPTTEKVHKVPLVIFPPWINKFYILDLKPQNSLLRWIADQGFTLFVVSWKNPDESYADFGMEDYYREGYLEAFAAIKAITGEPKINAVGYCIAGTTLSLTLARMAKDKDASVKSATFFTTLTDFEDQGEFTPFLSNDFVDGIEREAKASGCLSSKILARTFSYLRANDLIWQPAIRSYMLGEAPPAFDLLHWNGDGTNLPGRMAVEYLRGLCQDNSFATIGYELDGQVVRPSDIKIPFCAVACESDHIAAWTSSFAGFRRFGSKDKTFILSQSGHIAGIVNPPGKNKYGHFTNPAPMSSLSPEAWREGADFTPGSWWPRWGAWLAKQSGSLVPARHPGSHPDYPALAPAPGEYVKRQNA
ncbi:PHA/PHB synthase family protein [Falsigemmobacter intermedius]|uniref:Class I poly(R)-hydroxyalkanoic acid synthase n=1 Tax=Falsigemmobacter intermedius TaxID=1553448 RepID=A0A3S3UXS8_9RHOB|nr:class I poly(R)-hydroxyalkanoic acid synthase [Falsigemmobacter intermedius]RWY42222.1 class I poly(R)-hydroxyalkanoic acid synthase [Falsigemmobacter intermedius]